MVQHFFSSLDPPPVSAPSVQAGSERSPLVWVQASGPGPEQHRPAGDHGRPGAHWRETVVTLSSNPYPKQRAKLASPDWAKWWVQDVNGSAPTSGLSFRSVSAFYTISADGDWRTWKMWFVFVVQRAGARQKTSSLWASHKTDVSGLFIQSSVHLCCFTASVNKTEQSCAKILSHLFIFCVQKILF